MIALYFRLRAYFLREYFAVLNRYYPNASFRRADLWHLFRNLCDSPYAIHKRYAQCRGESDPYTFGETPLTTLETIAAFAGWNASDSILDLGCATGRTSLWLRCFIGSCVRGIDNNPEFIRRANHLARIAEIQEGLTFEEGDMLDCDFSWASGVYLYGTALEERYIVDLCDKMAEMRAGTSVVSISYSLEEYCTKFKCVKKRSVRFPWGETDAYFNIKLDLPPDAGK